MLTAISERLVDRLAPRAARHGTDGAQAAVALVLREVDDRIEILMIKRAEHDRDPWSGHVALPGGRVEPGDASLEDTALRETFEETGIDLRRDGHVLGALDDLQARSGYAMRVRPYVVALQGPLSSPLVLSDEVSAAFWVPLATFTAPDAGVESTVMARGVERRVPSFRHGEYVVWGMTERILRQLATLVGEPAS